MSMVYIFIYLCHIQFFSLVYYSFQMFWRLISLVQDLRVGVPNVDLKSFTPQGKVLYLWDASWPWNTKTGVCGFLFIMGLSLSLSAILYSIILCCRRSVHSVPKSPSEVIIPYVGIDLLCMRGGDFRFNAAILNSLPNIFLN